MIAFICTQVNVCARPVRIEAIARDPSKRSADDRVGQDRKRFESATTNCPLVMSVTDFKVWTHAYFAWLVGVAPQQLLPIS